jgi:short-subunit dehydrogenase
VRPPRFVFAGGTAVVTGAASGIGEAVAHALAGRGCDLVLMDRDAARLEAVASALAAQVRVTAHVVDLADADATRRVGRDVLAEHPRIRLLVNNAGVALGGRFDQVTLEEYFWLVDVNYGATVRLTHLLLPALKAESANRHPSEERAGRRRRPTGTDAHLVNVSSVFGIVAPPGQTAYSASKFAVRGFTEALRHELADDGIGVTCVFPGGIRTRIALSARAGSGVDRAEYEAARERFTKVLTIAPERAAEVILSGIHRRRARVLIGSTARLLDLLARAFPAAHGRIVAAAAKRYSDSPPSGAA